MRLQSFILILLLSAFAMFSCQQTTEGEDQLEVDQVVQEQAAFGFQINEIANTTSEIEQVTSDPLDMEIDSDLPEGNSLMQLKERALLMATQMKEAVAEIPVLAKTNADSVIWSNETYFNGYGKRSAIYYDSETGKGRWVEVLFQFPESRNMVYDSAEIKVDMNFTLWYGEDDRIESLYQQQLFKESYFVQSIESQIVVNSYDEYNEPAAVTASVDSRYHVDRYLQRKLATATIIEDESGTIREDFWFKDGTSSYAEFTFYTDNTGTFTKSRRDGTVISGTFNQLEDDGFGSYTSLIDFPSGFYLDQILRAASIWIVSDEEVRADYSEKIIFGNGNIDSTQTSVIVTEVDGVTITVMDILKRNGAHGTITITESEELSTLSGTWTTWDNYYIIVDAEYYVDGSGHMHYEVYVNEDAYNNGDAAIIIADYTFNGDQGGEGTLTHNGIQYNIEFDGSGTATISDGTDTQTINMYF